MEVTRAAYPGGGRFWSQLVITPVAVEKGTKAVISVNFGVPGERTFNNLQAIFVAETP